MESYQIGLLGFVALLILIALRVPIAFCLALVGLGGLFLLAGQEATFAMLSTQLYSSVANNALTAVPLFLLMGYFAFHAGLTRAAFSTARIWLANFPGGLAMGRVAIPEMLRYGYDRKLACGSIAAAATLAVLIPPSIVMVVYAIIVEASIGRLLMAGYLPCILSAIILIAMIYVRVKLKPELAPEALSTVTRA